VATDGSLASQVEDWLVDTIVAITDSGAVFEAVEVAAWDGSDEEAIDFVNTHLSDGKRDLAVQVRFNRDVAEPLEEGLVRRNGQYDVWVGIKNRRPGTARRGDGTKPGTNRMRELLINALHNKRPVDGEGELLTNLGWYSDIIMYQGAEIIWHSSGNAVMLCRFQTHEVEAS